MSYSLIYPFEYRKLGDFTYHIISDPDDIKTHLMKWSMWEWECDYSQAPDEHWTVAWMNVLPRMDFKLEILHLEDIQPNRDLWSVEQFQIELKERADERGEAILRGVSIAPLLINRNGFELMDGYTRYVVLKRYRQKQAYAYVGTVQA
jgi:hypothetical protein